MRNLDELRVEIDRIDKELLKLFKERMQISKEVGIYKKANSLPILDEAREKQILINKRASLNNEELWPFYEQFIQTILKISKEYQK